MLCNSRTLWTAAALSSALAVTGCAKDPSKDAPAATVSEPAPAAEPAGAAPAAPPPAEAAPAAPSPAPAAEAPAAPSAAAPSENAADAKALTGAVHAVGSKVTGSHTIVFQKWTGTVRLAGGSAEGGQLAFSIDMGSLVSDPDARTPFSEKLDGHLKSGDFFEVEKFPTATFASSAIKAGGENGASHTIKGNLTLRGTTKEISFPATIAVGPTEVTGKAEFSINRKDFGVLYTGKPDDLIRDGVVLKIDVKAAL